MTCQGQRPLSALPADPGGLVKWPALTVPIEPGTMEMEHPSKTKGLCLHFSEGPCLSLLVCSFGAALPQMKEAYNEHGVQLLMAWVQIREMTIILLPL